MEYTKQKVKEFEESVMEMQAAAGKTVERLNNSLVNQIKYHFDKYETNTLHIIHGAIGDMILEREDQMGILGKGQVPKHD